MKKLILILLLNVLALPVFAQTSSEMKIIAPREYEDSIKIEVVQLVDVRTPEEYKAGHIEGASNIDFFSEDFSVEFSKLDKNKPVYLYCRSGNRSQKAAAKLSEMGFKTIIDLEGGYKAWSQYQEKEQD